MTPPAQDRPALDTLQHMITHPEDNIESFIMCFLAGLALVWFEFLVLGMLCFFGLVLLCVFMLLLPYCFFSLLFRRPGA